MWINIIYDDGVTFTSNVICYLNSDSNISFLTKVSMLFVLKWSDDSRWCLEIHYGNVDFVKPSTVSPVSQFKLNGYNTCDIINSHQFLIATWNLLKWINWGLLEFFINETVRYFKKINMQGLYICTSSLLFKWFLWKNLRHSHFIILRIKPIQIMSKCSRYISVCK